MHDTQHICTKTIYVVHVEAAALAREVPGISISNFQNGGTLLAGKNLVWLHQTYFVVNKPFGRVFLVLLTMCDLPKRTHTHMPPSQSLQRWGQRSLC